MQVGEIFLEVFKGHLVLNMEIVGNHCCRGDVRGAGFVPPSATEAAKEQIQSSPLQMAAPTCTHFLIELNLLKSVVCMVRLHCYKFLMLFFF